MRRGREHNDLLVTLIDTGRDCVKGGLIVVGDDPEGQTLGVTVDADDRDTGAFEFFDGFLRVAVGLQDQSVDVHVDHAVDVQAFGVLVVVARANEDLVAAGAADLGDALDQTVGKMVGDIADEHTEQTGMLGGHQACGGTGTVVVFFNDRGDAIPSACGHFFAFSVEKKRNGGLGDLRFVRDFLYGHFMFR